MFLDIDKETTDRLSEAKWYLDNITESHSTPQEIFKEKLYKGSFFVNLYGAIEYTVCNLVSRVIDKIALENTIAYFLICKLNASSIKTLKQIKTD